MPITRRQQRSRENAFQLFLSDAEHNALTYLTTQTGLAKAGVIRTLLLKEARAQNPTLLTKPRPQLKRKDAMGTIVTEKEA